MKLKKLEILGFKSFRDKTPIDLSRDINAIVGPNGCGKSNIVDAIRWVMGEQRVTMLRGKKMEDVIFNGSDDAPAVNMAEVSITLESNGHRVPDKYSGYREITVSRKIFREGEGEYYINKVPCRLLDVKEFFMDAGVGARTYSIVEQERISNLVEAKPDERRQFIEEAAGIMKYKTRRDSAARKMESTKQNILRINDILREVRSQLNATSRQAKKAEKYRSLKKTIKEYQLALSLQACAELTLKINKLEQSRVPLDEKTLEAQTELKALESIIENIRERLVESEEEIGSFQDAYYGIKNEISIREQKITFANESISQLADKKEKDRAEIEALTERKNTTVEETAILEKQVAESEEVIAGIKDSITEEQETADTLKAVERDLSEELEREKSRHIDTITENARLGNLLSSLTKNLEDLDKKAERECGEIDENNKKLGILKEKLSAVQSDLSSDMEKIATLKERHKSTEESLSTAQDNLKAIDAHITKTREEKGAKASRLTSLKDLQERHEWCGEGTRHILEAARDRVLAGNIRGLVADYIEVPKQYETAVEAALDEKLQYIIVENQKDGREAIDYLKNHSFGRGSFVPVDNSSRAPLSRSGHPEGTQRLCDLVHITDEKFGNIVRRLLENVLLAPDLDTATRLWQKNGFTSTYVTPEGDILRPDGALIGGGRNGGGSSLGDKREIMELEKEIDVLGGDLQGQEQKREETNAAISIMEGEEAQLRSDIHGLELEINSREKDAERLEGEIKWVEQHINVLTFNRENLESEKTLTAEKKIAVENEITSRQNETKDGDRRILEIQEKWKKAREEVEEKEKSLTEKKILLISIEEKRKSGVETISRLKETISGIDERVESIAGDIDACDTKTVEAMENIKNEEETLKALYTSHKKTEEELAEKREKHERENIICREKEQAVQKVRKSSDALSKELGELEMDIREAVIHLETLKDGMKEKLAVDPDILLPDFQIMDTADAEELSKKLETSRKRLEEFGEVNLLALSEHEELKERYDFLSTQIKDLNSSLDTLQKTISRINQISRKKFSETFEAVSQNFKSVFPRLFPGGKGTLRLTDESDMLETGVDIDILIPGKKRQNLSLLSGGEKALAAVALIFSILMHRPAPFLLLDEADAPLDDANISLFRELLRDISANSQIVFITHNKNSMEAADNLIGVTMEKSGISTTVSVSMN